jgi:hypothetical protein
MQKWDVSHLTADNTGEDGMRKIKWARMFVVTLLLAQLSRSQTSKVHPD